MTPEVERHVWCSICRREMDRVAVNWCASARKGPHEHYRCSTPSCVGRGTTIVCVFWGVSS